MLLKGEISVIVKLKLFAASREIAGSGETLESLPDAATLRDLRDKLFAAYPDLGNLRVQFAVNRAYVSLDTVLEDGDEVACIPPVGGG